jgi:SAM-dependent methyltransferase
MQRRPLLAATLLAFVFAGTCATASAQTSKTYEPTYGQEGKDVIWIPTQPATIERMLRMAQVTARDTVVDLGSGDGRIAIAAVKDFGARAFGYEYNPDMVEFSKREAEKAGVSGKVEFRKADIFETDFSHATVITMYLLPHLNIKLRPIILGMKPGIRVSSHQFDMGDWKPDEVSEIGGRRAYFWLVPAKVEGDWKLAFPGRDYTLSLRQEYQMISGHLSPGPGQMGLRDAVLSGANIRFSFVDEQSRAHTFVGTVDGSRMSGTVTAQGGQPVAFTATKNP